MCRLFFKRLPNDDVAADVLKSNRGVAPYTYDCYSPYDNYYDGSNKGGEIYFGFFADNKIKKLVDEINENFKNIEVKIVFEAQNVSFNGDYFEYESTNKPNFLPYYIFRIELNDKYTQEANYVLTLAIAMFVRGFCTEYHHYNKSKLLTKDFINGVLEAQGSSYGGWMCASKHNYYTCPRSVFDKFDNINLVNKVTTGQDTEALPYISNFIWSLK